MSILEPRSSEEMAQALASAAAQSATIKLGGTFSKDWMGGPIAPAGVTISTAAMNKVVEYEPRDLTISVEAGMPYAELTRLLAEHRQMIPLDPPWAENSTIGGVVASNLSGPRRRLYGTARDLIIGMKFATMEGKVIQSGGMVVKNVAGLDMAKVMIGSLGTLAAITVVNFKLAVLPAASRTFALQFVDVDSALAERSRILSGVLQPAAIDLLNPPAARLAGMDGYLLLVSAGGSASLMDRYSRELSGAVVIEGPRQTELWEGVREFIPRFLAAQPQGAVVRVSKTLAGIGSVASAAVPVVARAGTGVCYACFPQCEEAARNVWKGLVEFASPDNKRGLTQWPEPGSDFPMMEKLKEMLDPRHLLNRGRLYGRI